MNCLLSSKVISQTSILLPDDSQLYLSFGPNEEQDEMNAIKSMELCVNDIRNWISRNKLLVNDRKTEFLIIRTRQQLQKVDINSIFLGAQDTFPADLPINNLGVWLDRNLSMDAHIRRTCSAAFYYLYNVRRIRPYLSRQATESLVHAL